MPCRLPCGLPLTSASIHNRWLPGKAPKGSCKSRQASSLLARSLVAFGQTGTSSSDHASRQQQSNALCRAFESPCCSLNQRPSWVKTRSAPPIHWPSGAVRSLASFGAVQARRCHTRSSSAALQAATSSGAGCDDCSRQVSGLGSADGALPAPAGAVCPRPAEPPPPPPLLPGLQVCLAGWLDGWLTPPLLLD